MAGCEAVLEDAETGPTCCTEDGYGGLGGDRGHFGVFIVFVRDGGAWVLVDLRFTKILNFRVSKSG